MRTILICLNQLGIGGVETAVLNYTIKLIENNYKVVILAKDGIYRKKFEEYGAIFEEFEFKVENIYDNKKIEKVIEIIEKYKIEQVHIHQFDCINSVFPACVIKNTPYIAYAHTGIKGVYDWFENSFPGYKEMFEIYFNCAQKIIPITNQAKEENQKKYKIPDEKYIIIKNSINFEDKYIKESKEPTKINNFLIISRLDKEKEISIKNAIVLFKKYHEKNKEAKLTIVGDGEIKENIEKEAKDIEDVTTFLGKRNDVMNIISKNDVVIGIDRCILEAIAMKKIAIISGYEEMKNIVMPEIIDKLAENNFSGENIEIKTIPEIIEIIEKLTKEKIDKIAEENYKYIYKNLNISNNIHFIDVIFKQNLVINPQNLIQSIMKIQNSYSKEIIEKEKIYEEYKKLQKKVESLELELKNKETQSEKTNKILNEAKEELNSVYNSKTWKLANKIKQIIKGKKN